MQATKWKSFIRLLLLAAAVVFQLAGQGDRGVITGTVMDASGAVVPGAQIIAVQKNTNTSFKTTSSSTGDYTVPSVPVGSYQVRVEKQGFKTHVTEKVMITPGTTARVDVKLDIGAAQQSVEVVANAQVVQSENARVSTEVSSALVDALPVQVNGTSRSPFDLAGTTAEVNSAGHFRIGGGSDTAGVTLDGSSLTGDKLGTDVGSGSATAMNSPSVEALTEFNVESSGFKAESGNASGGTLSFVSKSGTNDFHGSAFEFLRNQDLDAKGFFECQQCQVHLQAEQLRGHGRRAGMDPQNLQRQEQDVSSSPRTKASATAWARATARPTACRRRQFYTGDLSQLGQRQRRDVPGLRSGSQVQNANGRTSGRLSPITRFRKRDSIRPRTDRRTM